MGALIEDTRQQRGKHDIKAAYFEQNGECVHRCALPVGDYQRPAKVAVDTKRDIHELAMDLYRDHARFREECKTAQKICTQLVILVENTDGVRCMNDLANLTESNKAFRVRNGNGNAKRYKGLSLARMCETMHKKYGVLFGFCTPQEVGKKIIDILNAYGGD
jgi:ribosome-associated protein